MLIRKTFNPKIMDNQFHLSVYPRIINISTLIILEFISLKRLRIKKGMCVVDICIIAYNLLFQATISSNESWDMCEDAGEDQSLAKTRPALRNPEDVTKQPESGHHLTVRLS